MSASPPEFLLIAALNAVLDGVSAYGDVPAQRPDTFVTVERTGGTRTLFLDAGIYAVQCWAGTRAEAALLADSVADRLLMAPASEPRIANVTVESVYDFPDPDSKAARYQLTVSSTITTN